MNHLLVIALSDEVPEGFLDSLRQAGWRISVTSDLVFARQILQKGNVDGVIIEFGAAGEAAERFKVLRCVREYCPGAMVVMLNSSAGVFKGTSDNLVTAMNAMDDVRNQADFSISDSYRLSPAQKRMAELVAQAHPNREIARRLKIKEQSVRNELSRIFKKMGIRNRVELALLIRKENADKIETTEPTSAEALGNPWPAGLKPPTQEPAPTLPHVTR